jgi:hypothetical protein
MNPDRRCKMEIVDCCTNEDEMKEMEKNRDEIYKW